jgi:hypothetical protein
MESVIAASAHWKEGSVHFEWFAAPDAKSGPNEAFEMELVRSDLVLTIPPDRSILQIVREHGIDVPSACEEACVESARRASSQARRTIATCCCRHPNAPLTAR